MSRSAHTVDVSNSWCEGADERRYCVFPNACKITGAGGQASTVRRFVCHLTTEIPFNGHQEFKCAQTFHAFIGRLHSEKVLADPGRHHVLPGKKLRVSFIRSEMEVPVKLGSDMRNGTCLDAIITAGNGLKLQRRSMEAPEGTFQIQCTQATAPAADVWVGLAQTINNTTVAVCGVPFVPRAIYTVTPVADSIRVALAPEWMTSTGIMIEPHTFPPETDDCPSSVSVPLTGVRGTTWVREDRLGRFMISEEGRHDYPTVTQ
ncbi:hypothetical protein V8F20_012712 [Naviculisporaceae sp. PSN 640]